MPEAAPDPIDAVLAYHERTKHHLQRYARSLGYLDWSTQPDPFRRFDGAPQFQLDEVPITAEPSFDALFDGTALAPRPLDKTSISQFFYDALALSAWKEYGGNRWSLRINPSSGNLHPTEGYLLAAPIAGLSDTPALHHYAPYQHALEVRRECSVEAWAALKLPPGTFLVGLTSIYWREAWKYGERAFRYCQHDLGHAIAALTISARALGWHVRLLDGLPRRQLAALLGVEGQSGPEAEHADTLLVVSPEKDLGDVDPAALNQLGVGPLLGTPNVLSSDHQDWPIIELVGEATERPERGETRHADVHRRPSFLPVRATPRSARQIVHQRRSAVSMDGLTDLSRTDFFRMLERVTPATNPTVFGVLPWEPSIQLALFVHRVRELPAGLYFLVRDANSLPDLRAATRPEFEWERVEEAPETIQLFRLVPTDVREAARIVSCHQEIASDGAFAVAMIARFEPCLRKHGAWFYRRLHWETGMIGQQLYLEAEAAGIRATGIGCFFDDVMHDVLGLKGAGFQTLYHFTVGGPVEDTRLRTVAPYVHLHPR